MTRARLAWAAWAIGLLVAGAAPAQELGPLEIGGRNTLNLSGSVNTTTVGDSTNGDLSILLAHVTQDARHEFGVGVTISGFASDDLDSIFYTPFLSYRRNSGFFGPERNALVYLGLQLGVQVADLDDRPRQTDAAGGVRIGLEYYFTPRVAVYGEDTLTVSGDPRDNDGASVSNRVALGLRVVF
ncbi:MAG: hypothetical protein MJE66_09115 [Proteobacteria bacterium]|nr:hypothetical protein [Pseudomonadota bacterium]